MDRSSDNGRIAAKQRRMQNRRDGQRLLGVEKWCSRVVPRC
jgi:hypothetical protein